MGDISDRFPPNCFIKGVAERSKSTIKKLRPNKKTRFRLWQENGPQALKYGPYRAIKRLNSRAFDTYRLLSKA